jgi:hypothetical protein
MGSDSFVTRCSRQRIETYGATSAGVRNSTEKRRILERFDFMVRVRISRDPMAASEARRAISGQSLIGCVVVRLVHIVGYPA